MCVANILTSLFDISDLQTSTMTGRRSNRKTDSTENIKKLDPTILGACKGRFSKLKLKYVLGQDF